MGYRLARGAFWSLAGAAVLRGLTLLASVVAARILGKQGFGELGILQATFGMFGTFAGFGLGLTSTKYLAEFRVSDPQRAGRILTLSACTAWTTGALGGLILVVLAPWLASSILLAPHLSRTLAAGALLVLFGAVNGTQTGALAGLDAFKRIALVNIWSGCAAFPALCIGSYFFAVPGAVWGLVASQGLACAFNLWAIKEEVRRLGICLWTSGWHKELPVLWRFSLPTLIGASIYAPANWIAASHLVNRPHGYAEMGAFSAAAQLYGILLFLPSVLGNVALPLMSEGVDHRTGARQALALSVKVNFLVAALPALLIAPLSGWIAQAFGRSFSENRCVFAVAILTTIPLALGSPYQRFLSARGYAWAACGTNITHSAVYLALSFQLVGWGALGLALARLVAHMVDGAYSMLAVNLRKRGSELPSDPVQSRNIGPPAGPGGL